VRGGPHLERITDAAAQSAIPYNFLNPAICALSSRDGRLIYLCPMLHSHSAALLNPDGTAVRSLG